jgi:hypothetical protein
MGGEGIVLKDPASLYRPGERSPAWLKLKPKLTLDVKVTAESADRIAWGERGEAVMLEMAYKHPRTGQRVEIRQAVRIAGQQPFELKIGAGASVVCWGVMPSWDAEASIVSELGVSPTPVLRAAVDLGLPAKLVSPYRF